MVKKKLLVIWFASNSILSLYFILRRIQLERTLREQEEKEQTSQEHMQVFERRYADFSSINEHGVAQKKKIQEHKKRQINDVLLESIKRNYLTSTKNVLY